MVTTLETASPVAKIEVPIGLARNVATYYLFNDIDNAEAQRFCASIWEMAASLVEIPGGRIRVLINSGGGSVAAGFAMIEMMYKVKRELRIPIDTVILGYAYSMGALVFQAGDQRHMGYFSTMMLHPVSWQTAGSEQQVFTDLKKLADIYRDMVGELFYRRTGLHSQHWWQRFIYSGKDRYLSARESLELRLADEVCPFLDECYLLAQVPEPVHPPHTAQ